MFLNWTNYLFHFLSAKLYTLPQAKYLCQFVCGDKYLSKTNSVYKIGPQTRLSIDVEGIGPKLGFAYLARNVFYGPFHDVSQILL